MYITGSYTPRCCPEYLKKENFVPLADRSDRITLHTATLSEFLRQNPGSYTHFVLLDHQDWMANTNPGELRREWQLILDNAAPGAKILFRSACQNADFLPDLVRDKITFQPHLTGKLHRSDRVGTYGSTHLGIAH